jgi:ABC-type transporter Mla subunit MlaD
MTITLSLADIGYFIIFALIVAVCVYSVIILYRLNQVLKDTQSFLNKHRDNLDRTMENLPEILDNVNEASEIVLHGVDKAEVAIDSISTSITETAASFRQGATGVAGYVQIVTEIVDLIRSLIRKR